MSDSFAFVKNVLGYITGFFLAFFFLFAGIDLFFHNSVTSMILFITSIPFMVLSAISVFIGLSMIFSFAKSKYIDKKTKYTDFGRTSSVFCALPFVIIAILFYFSPIEGHAFYSYLWLGVTTPFLGLFISAKD